MKCLVLAVCSRRSLQHTYRLFSTSAILSCTSPNYDIVQLLKDIAVPTPRLNYPEFTGPIKSAFISEAKGRGIVTTRNIKAGELLSATKAFADVYDSEVEPNTVSILDALTKKVLSRLRQEPALIQSVYGLWAGKEIKPATDEETEAVVQGRQPCNVSRVTAIVQNNAFGDAMYRDESDKSVSPEQSSVGLWPQASLFNHSCDPNCLQVRYGDLLFIRAIKNLAEGEEVLLCYYPNQGHSVNARRAYLMDLYGFHCECLLCKIDDENEARFPEQMSVRREFISRFIAGFGPKLEAAFAADDTIALSTILDKLEDHVTQFEPLMYPGRFDPFYYDLLKALADAYSICDKPRNAFEAYSRAHASMWNSWQLFSTLVPNSDESPKDSSYIYSVLGDEATRNAMLLAILCHYKLSEKAAAKHWLYLSYAVFRTMYGCDTIESYIVAQFTSDVEGIVYDILEQRKPQFSNVDISGSS